MGARFPLRGKPCERRAALYLTRSGGHVLPMSEARDGGRAAVIAVVLVVGGMGSIVFGGAITFALLSPEFVEQTLAGLQGGETSMGVTLFAIQLLGFLAIATGFIYVIYRNRRR